MRVAEASSIRATRTNRGGFTLAEALAALTFLAIVIPVAVQAIRLASQSGQVAIRKADAMGVADRLLNEMVVTGQWQTSGSGTVIQGNQEFRWQMRNQGWQQDPMRAITLVVQYTIQGVERDVRLTTLVDSSVTSR